MSEYKPLVFRFDDVEVREREFMLIKAGDVLPVEPKTFRLLLFLLHNPHRLTTKEELLDAVWGDAAVTESSLTRTVALLRRVLGDDIKEPRYIATVPTVGYRLVCEVEAFEEPPKALRALSGGNGVEESNLTNGPPGQVASTPEGETKSEIKQKGRRTWHGIRLAAAVVITIVAALPCAYWYLIRPLPPPRITGFTQITRDGRTKDLRGMDGSRLYFTQPSPNEIAQVNISGGEIAEVPIEVPEKGLGIALRDVSRDGSNALIALVGGNEEKKAADSLWIAPILGGTAKRLDAGESGSFCPDGSEVIYSTEEGELFLSRTDGTEKRRLANVGSRAYWFKWSPDGKTIRFTRNDGTLWEMNSDGSAIHRLLSDWTEEGFLCCGEWTLEGGFYLFHLYKSEAESDVWALDERHRPFRPRSPAPVRLTTGPIQWGASVLSRDGKKIFVDGITPRGELSRIDPKTGSLQPFLGGISAEFVSFSPDRRSLAYVLFPEGTLWKADLDGRNCIQLSEPPNHVSNPRWSPDSKQILFISSTIGFQHSAAYIVPAIGGIPRKVIPGEGVEPNDANWSSDGSKVVVAWQEPAAKPSKRDLRIIDLKSGQIEVVPGSAGFFSVRWSPDGRYLAAFAYPSMPALRIFDFKSERWTAVPVNGDIEFPSFSHDSRYIYFVRPRRDQGVFRIPVTGGKEKRVANMTDWHLTGLIGFSMTLDPTDAPLVLRDVGSDDIYALTFEP